MRACATRRNLLGWRAGGCHEQRNFALLTSSLSAQVQSDRWLENKKSAYVAAELEKEASLP